MKEIGEFINMTLSAESQGIPVAWKEVTIALFNKCKVEIDRLNAEIETLQGDAKTAIQE